MPARMPRLKPKSANPAPNTNPILQQRDLPALLHTGCYVSLPYSSNLQSPISEKPNVHYLLKYPAVAG